MVADPEAGGYALYNITGVPAYGDARGAGIRNILGFFTDAEHQLHLLYVIMDIEPPELISIMIIFSIGMYFSAVSMVVVSLLTHKPEKENPAFFEDMEDSLWKINHMRSMGSDPCGTNRRKGGFLCLLR